jgi:hypothetical protein
MNPSDEVAAVGGPPGIGQQETVQLTGLPVPRPDGAIPADDSARPG